MTEVLTTLLGAFCEITLLSWAIFSSLDFIMKMLEFIIRGIRGIKAEYSTFTSWKPALVWAVYIVLTQVKGCL